MPKNENRVYYGEYSLKHWIDLLVKRNIILPEYQRSFVWDDNAVKSLFKSIDKGYFVPPVTIGFFKKGDNEFNYIIDGQQRLTSLLLLYLKCYPDKDKFINSCEDTYTYADDNDDSYENDATMQEGVEWSLKTLIRKPSDIKSVQRSVFDSKKYEELSIDEWSEEFFEKNYLGFSYLVPENDQGTFFSTVFRDINTLGVPLSMFEARKSLYFFKDEELDKVFEPECLKKVMIIIDKKSYHIDFVRYLAITSQCKKIGCYFNEIAKGYGKRFEDYYESFIYVVSNSSDDISFECYPKDTYFERIDKLKEMLESVNIENKTFTSIIDADLYLFGLVYYVIYEQKKLKQTIEGLTGDIETAITRMKDSDLHKKNPAALKYLRERLNLSITIYKRYVE